MATHPPDSGRESRYFNELIVLASRKHGVKDHRNHAVATHLGQVMVRLPRFRCAGCGAIEAGIGWPSHCRSTPELDQLQAHFSALMTYRVAAERLKNNQRSAAPEIAKPLKRLVLFLGIVQKSN